MTSKAATVPAKATASDEPMPNSSLNQVAETRVKMNVSVVAIILHVRVLARLLFLLALISSPIYWRWTLRIMLWVYSLAFIDSKTTAIPCPPPMQAVATPYLPPLFLSSRDKVSKSLVPVAANG